MKKEIAVFTAAHLTDESGIEAAKEYIRMHGLTKNDCRLVKRMGVVQVIKEEENGRERN